MPAFEGPQEWWLTKNRYNIRSLRFNSADSAYLSRTPASAGNRKTWTWAGWVKRSALGSLQNILGAGQQSTNDGIYSWLRFDANDKLNFRQWTDAVALSSQLTTTAVFRDCSAWYHLVFAYDSTQATDSNKIKIYINGTQITAFDSADYPGLNDDAQINNTKLHTIGSANDGGSQLYHFNGYLADCFLIDGQALEPTSFGLFDENGIWQPKNYIGAYGTNGFHLDFNDNSSATALGTDTSGNDNDWTVNNISITAGSGNDSLVDVPVNYGVDTGVGGEVLGNYCTLNPLVDRYNIGTSGTKTFSQGNLQVYASTGDATRTRYLAGTLGASSGKWYYEATIVTIGGQLAFGIADNLRQYENFTNTYIYLTDSRKFVEGSISAYGSSSTTNDVIGVAFDLDSGTIEVFKNGTTMGVMSSSVNPGITYLPAFDIPAVSTTASEFNVNFGQRPFSYQAPEGFKALCTTNLPTATVKDGSKYMDVVTYTGNGSTQTISGLGFSPDLVWMKVRSIGYNHTLIDSVRGATKTLSSSMTVQEYTEPTGPTAFTSDGWSMSGDVTYVGSVNANGQTYAGWCWDAGSSTVTNTDGSITSSVRANPSAGFSIVTWTSDGASSIQTMGTGLNATPGLIIAKNRSISGNWWVWHSSFSNQVRDYLLLQTTDAKVTAGVDVWSTSSTTFGIRQATIANNTNQCVAYCFAPVFGYSAMGSYTSNNSSDGPFIYTGFRPRYVLIKNITSGSTNWRVMDSARDDYNDGAGAKWLKANTSGAEVDERPIDFLSNGFKIRVADGGDINYSTNVMIYAAFAESPFQYARAR